MDAEELLSTTRSVRRRLDLDRPVDLELIRRCLRLALQAPTGAGRQHWRWLVLTDPGQREALATVYRAAFHARYPPDTDDPRVPPRDLASARYLAANLHRVPVLVVACLELPGGQLPEGNQAGVWGSLLPAAWSYMLAARAHGLGTAWTAVHLDREAEAAKVLRLPENVRQGALIPTAHTRGRFGPARRRSVEAVWHLDGWNGS